MSTSKTIQWDHPNPHQIKLNVEQKHIDVIGHVNNVVYLRWLERVAWHHSEHLGLDWEKYSLKNRAMVARRHELDYLAAAFEHDKLLIGTWITENDGKVSITRQYQIIRESDGRTLLRGKTKWVCIDMNKGKAVRMPESFVSGYRKTI